MTVLAWAAALMPMGGSWSYVLIAGVAVLVCWVCRRPVLLIIAVTVLAATSAGAAWQRIQPGAPQAYEGVALLASDPEPVQGGVRVHADINGDRYVLRAWGSPAGWLRNRLMGESVSLRANLRPLGDAPDWLRSQGLSGRGTVTAVVAFDVGMPHTRLANSIRRTIESGAIVLDRDQHALFAGLVYGDDRQQSVLVADNFKAAGLTHLLAVSGQNVAFALAIAGPILRRLDYRRRFVFVVAILILFATVTRFEPSVIRASVMTAVAAVGALVGTEVTSRRVLGLAIVALVVVDPLIVHRVAFQLSVAASAGILFWSGRVARSIPGPRWLAESIAITSTAQLAVAPLLLWRFDGLPVASLPANVLAGPAAGPIMMWGLTAGLVAGLAPVWCGVVIHAPTEIGLWWIDSVGAAAAKLPLGQLRAVHIGLLLVVGAIGLTAHTTGRRRAAVVGLALVLLQPWAALVVASPGIEPIDGQSTIWQDRHYTVVEIDTSTRPADVLAAVRLAAVETIDLVILRQDARANASLVRWLRTRHDIGAVWAPATTLGVGEQLPPTPTTLSFDDFALVITVVEDELATQQVRLQ